MVRRGLAKSRAQAQRIILAGEVRLGDQVIDKPGLRIAVDAPISVTSRHRFVSRGGDKLEAALTRFELDVSDLVIADVGSSTGGFTDCLLQRGAARVYAIDVGYGQLAWRLRNDPRVVVMERTNARYLKKLPEAVDLITVDVSFISLKLILPAALGWIKPSGQVVALIKPQFEAGKSEVGKGGVVRDPQVHRTVLERVTQAAAEHLLSLKGLMPSPLKGPAGNIEFLAWWDLTGDTDPKSAIETCLSEVEAG
jgi:23S rRNA (cytidine1920-2'-O)/16S rRNA (cytidine1409-2'-O)-methyltransferase